MLFTKPIIASLIFSILIISAFSTFQFSHTGKVIKTNEEKKAVTTQETSSSTSTSISSSTSTSVSSTSTALTTSSVKSTVETTSSTTSTTSSTTSTILENKPSKTSEGTDHILINEVQVSPNEFVELYNPTDEDIDLSGWYLCYFSSKKDWNEPYRKWKFENRTIIKAHTHYLINVYNSTFPNSDLTLLTKKKKPYSVGQLSNSKGSIAILPFDPKGKSAEEAKSGRIDALGWGNVSHVFEGVPCSTPSRGKSLERNSHLDTDNNSLDFIITTPTPENSSMIS